MPRPLVDDSELHFESANFQPEEIACLQSLRRLCENQKLELDNHLIYRFAIYHGFNVKRASNAILKKHDHPYLHLKLEDDLAQFITGNMIYIPIPGLKTQLGADVLYMRPSRFEPSATNNRLIVEQFCFALNAMSRTVDQCRRGVTLIANLDGYTRKNFHFDTHRKLTRVQDGHMVPTRIVQILIVNTPKFIPGFLKFTGLSAMTSQRIRFIQFDKLGDYLMEGCEELLPDEFSPKGKPILGLLEEFVGASKRNEAE